MPADPHGTFTIDVTFGSSRRADLVMSGDVDLAARQPLANAVDQLAAAAPDLTVVDLAAVTFAGATLVNFLADVRLTVPAGSVLVACHATSAVEHVLTIPDAADFATIHHDRTCDSPGDQVS